MIDGLERLDSAIKRLSRLFSSQMKFCDQKDDLTSLGFAHEWQERVNEIKADFPH
jgi:hypothetical protein